MKPRIENLKSFTQIISSPVIEDQGQSPFLAQTSSSTIPQSDIKGGIDFRALPIVTQAMGNLRASLGTVFLKHSAMALAETVPINLDKEWLEIERVDSAGIRPSTQRIKEYIQASCVKGDIDVDKVLNCISEVLRQEEESCSQTDNTLRDILVVLEASRSNQELKEVFVGT